MRAARKCGHTRRAHFTPCSTRRLKRPQRNLLQNPLKQHVPLMSSVVPKTVFVEVSLQVLCANVVVDPTDSTLHSAPESFDGIGVNVARDVNAFTVTDAPMGIAEILKAIVRNEIVSEHDTRGHD